MLSGRLVETIEAHWQDIAVRLILKIRRNSETPTLAALPDAEIREWCEIILANLGEWLTSGTPEKVRRRYEAGGRAPSTEDLPLTEAVLRFQLLKNVVLDFVHEEWEPVNSMQLYAEEELERRVGRFFDALVYYAVARYEKARKLLARYA